MSNPLYNELNKNNVMPNIARFMQEVRHLQQTFNGNPQEVVQSMIKDGRMSQDQFNQYAQMASQIMAMMHK